MLTTQARWMEEDHPRESPRRVGLVVASRFPAPRGSQIHVGEMARCLAAAGEDVHLVAPLDPRGLETSYKSHPLSRIVRFRPRPSVSGLHLLERPIFDSLLAARLLDVVIRERLELLHAHNYEALAAALMVRRWTGVRVVYHAHNVAEDELPLYAPRWLASTIRRAARELDRRLPALADAVVVLSPDVGRHLEKQGVAPKRIWEIPPGLDATPFQEGRRAVRTPHVVFAGNLDRYQNIDFLYRAWAMVGEALPGAELRIVTHARGAALQRWRNEQRPARIRIVEARDLAEVAAELGSARVGVSPRSSWSGYPIKILNYMAAGLPTVALRGSAKGVRDGETGWIAPSESPDAFAATLRKPLEAPREAARRGALAYRRLLTDHSWRLLAPALLECSHAVLAAARKGQDLRALPPRAAAQVGAMSTGTDA